MIILDTNVLSELMKTYPQVKVIAWVAAQPSSSLFTTFVTENDFEDCGIQVINPWNVYS